MIDDIVFDGVKFFELETNEIGLYYPIAIIFGIINSTDIIPIEKITII